MTTPDISHDSNVGEAVVVFRKGLGEETDSGTVIQVKPNAHALYNHGCIKNKTLFVDGQDRNGKHYQYAVTFYVRDGEWVRNPFS